MSAVARLHSSTDGDVWDDRIERALIHLSTVTRLEIGYAARNGPDLRGALSEPPIGRMPVAYLTPAIEERAVEVQQLLADRGHHSMTTDARELDPVDERLVAFARSIAEQRSDGLVHTVGAAVLDGSGRMHGGINLFHFNGGPCAELVGALLPFSRRWDPAG